MARNSRPCAVVGDDRTELRDTTISDARPTHSPVSRKPMTTLRSRLMPGQARSLGVGAHGGHVSAIPSPAHDRPEGHEHSEQDEHRDRAHRRPATSKRSRPMNSKPFTGMLAPEPRSLVSPRKATSVPSVVMIEFTRSLVMANALMTATQHRRHECGRHRHCQAEIAWPRPRTGRGESRPLSRRRGRPGGRPGAGSAAPRRCPPRRCSA